MKTLIKDHYQFIAGIMIFTVIILLKIEFYKAVILLLELIVILEVVKMIADFIEKNKISLRFVLDIFIIFLIRDIVILVTTPEIDTDKILFLIFIILMFFIFRLFAIKYSPILYKKKSL
jgi:uncharacterized membrane protein (DUF373 family)